MIYKIKEKNDSLHSDKNFYKVNCQKYLFSVNNVNGENISIVFLTN